MINFDYSYLDERFEICPLSKTGLRWKPRQENTKRDINWNKLYAGKDCGNITIDKGGRAYYVSSVSRNNDGKKVYNHKVVYALYHKKDLDGQIIIGHKDGNTTNNQPENLMECHNSEQYNNSNKLHSRNKSGYPGVHFDKIKNKHIAQITYKLKKIKIGSYLTQEEAIKARQDFEKKLYGS